jgi:hypothetical protein
MVDVAEEKCHVFQNMQLALFYFNIEVPVKFLE